MGKNTPHPIPILDKEGSVQPQSMLNRGTVNYLFSTPAFRRSHLNHNQVHYITRNDAHQTKHRYRYDEQGDWKKHHSSGCISPHTIPLVTANVRRVVGSSQSKTFDVPQPPPPQFSLRSLRLNQLHTVCHSCLFLSKAPFESRFDKVWQ